MWEWQIPMQKSVVVKCCLQGYIIIIIIIIIIVHWGLWILWDWCRFFELLLEHPLEYYN